MKTKYIGDLFPGNRWYLLMGMAVLFFVVSFFYPALFEIAAGFAVLVMVVSMFDYYLLFFGRGTVRATRIMSARFSLGDTNKVTLSLANLYPFQVRVKLIDELPEQFQARNSSHAFVIPYMGRNTIVYHLKPLTRGEYEFGDLLCYVRSPLGLLQRKISNAAPAAVKVYPSYHQLKKFQLMATSDNLYAGMKKIRRLGHSMEFEKIKPYVLGDDIRNINWKATARSTELMVNTFTDARQQQVYAIIDKGRAMKMPFEGMTLLDYSINATLSLLNIVLLKYDKAGLMTFANQPGNLIPAERRSGQLTHIIEALYKQQTDFKESSYEALWANVHKKITQRSFILLFTNFETWSSLERQLPYLKRIASRHLLCVVFFQNTLLKEIHETQPDTTEGIYIKTIAERFDFEKRQIVKELRRDGILSILTTPQHLTVDVINKYLELKARQMV
jgi:uncharacterized protein (DUF58 family)